MRALRLVWLGLCGLMLISCISSDRYTVPGSVSSSVSAIPDEATHPSDLRDAHMFRIAPAKSMLHILVYRAGSMAQLGHNHVMSAGNLSGYIWMHDSLLQRSGFDIRLPVNDLIVDDPDARSAEGPDFPLNVTDEGRAGTKVNMLKPDVLDGEHYPQVRLRSVNISGNSSTPEVTVAITIKDQTRQQTVPVRITVDQQSLRVAGEFTIRQTDFGITHHSAMLGALLVQDLLTIKFDLEALPVN